MCRTVHALLQTVICGIQMLVRVFMTVILMIENVIRMLLQTLYNFISFLLQMISLIPICVVFLLTARLKCFMCGGGGPCPVNRGGTCDCLMSAMAFVILFLIFRATGVLDKIFYSLGYAKAAPTVYKFVPTPGDVTECSRNDSDSGTLTPPTVTFVEYETPSSTVEDVSVFKPKLKRTPTLSTTATLTPLSPTLTRTPTLSPTPTPTLSPTPTSKPTPREQPKVNQTDADETLLRKGNKEKENETNSTDVYSKTIASSELETTTSIAKTDEDILYGSASDLITNGLYGTNEHWTTVFYYFV